MSGKPTQQPEETSLTPQEGVNPGDPGPPVLVPPEPDDPRKDPRIPPQREEPPPAV